MRRSKYKIVSKDSDCWTLQDCGPWDIFLSLTNDIENVVKELHADGLGGAQLLYWDSDNILTEAYHDGKGNFTGFGPDWG